MGDSMAVREIAVGIRGNVESLREAGSKLVGL